MERDKQIFVAMVLKTVLDRFMEDGYRNQRTTTELMLAFQPRTVLLYAETAYDDYFGKLEEQQERHGTPQPQQEAPQPQYAEQGGPQPISNELRPQGSTGALALWEPGPNDHIPPNTDHLSGARWIDYIPFKGKGWCDSAGKAWSDVTYRDILATFQVQLDAPGKPTYQSDWGTLSWLIKSADLQHEKFGRNNRYKVSQLKAVMLEVARRRPWKGPTPKPQQGAGGRYVEDADETAAMIQDSGTPYGPMDESTPF